MPYPSDISISDAIKRYGLPKSHRVHWSASRKADVVRAVHERAISFHEARERYLLSRREFEEWERDYAPACARRGDGQPAREEQHADAAEQNADRMQEA